MARAMVPTRSHFPWVREGGEGWENGFISFGQKSAGALRECAGAINAKCGGYWPTLGPESLLLRGPAFGVAAYGKTRLYT